MFIGSCFASEIGSKLKEVKFPVLINPSGTVYNPVSVANALQTVISNKVFKREDLFNYNDRFLSFYHYTNFSSENPEKCLSDINEMTQKAHKFLSDARFLFVTLGTARVYRLKETGEIVSNCHKLPGDRFTQELLSVGAIIDIWKKTIDDLRKYNKNLNIVFTVSPVRHWKDGAHGNQVSKSVLILAIEELIRYSSESQYFPAYELLMDDLRDYRFYADDMLHPSASAIEYIWEKFSDCFLEKDVQNAKNEVLKIVNAYNHRITNPTQSELKKFAEKILKKIELIKGGEPSIDLTEERNYFFTLLKK